MLRAPDEAAAGSASHQSKRLLFIGHYPVTELNSAAKVRIAALRDALAPRCDLTFITGHREDRRRPLWDLIRSGRWRRFDGVYVEAASSTAMEADLLLMALWRRQGIPVGVFVRDAFPLFPDVYDDRPWKHKLLKLAWHLSIAAYRRYAAILYYPTRRLADLFEAPDQRLLPPAGHWQGDGGGSRRGAIYVGPVSPRYGVIENLLPAAEQLAAGDAAFRLTIVTQDAAPLGEWRQHPWLEVTALSGEALSERLRQATVAVVPFRRHPYMDLAMPVKLLHYLAHGLPVVVTDCPEMADFVRQNDVGEVVPATPAGVAEGLARLLGDEARYAVCAAQAAAALQGPHSWDQRAETILSDLFADGTAQREASVRRLAGR